MSFISYFGPLSDRVSVSFKGQDNILLRRPPVSRTPSSQDGLSELPDPVSRGKGSSGGLPDGMLISKYQCPCGFVLL